MCFSKGRCVDARYICVICLLPDDSSDFSNVIFKFVIYGLLTSIVGLM